jgi:nitroreductase
MDFEEVLNKRFTVRSYDSKEVEDDKIKIILEAGRMAPSAKNGQPIRIIVCKSSEALLKVDSVSPCRYGAPVAFIICASKEKAWSKEGYSSYDTDASICTTYMMLESANLGLGSVWVGMFDTNKTKEVFSISEEYTPVAMLMVGHKKEGAGPLPTHNTRKSIEELVEFL